MEPLHQDDPLRIGPYRVLARVRESAGWVRYLALADDGTPSVVARVRPRLAEVPACRRRFTQETRTAERLAGGWVEPTEASTDAPPLWTAGGYLPAVTLREAIALAGPLPERTVRVVGAAIAETLSRVHATGTALQGLSPDTVLLAADGPRLTAFGPLGAAVIAEAGADGRLTVKLGYLTPEQAAGARPGPASDLFVLGQLLAYAATGTTPLADADAIAHAEPDLGAVPSGLRPVVARCLAKSPEDRPAAGTVAAELALEGAAALARAAWLPEAVTAALASQRTEVARLASAPPETGPEGAPVTDPRTPPADAPTPAPTPADAGPATTVAPVPSPGGDQGAAPTDAGPPPPTTPREAEAGPLPPSAPQGADAAAVATGSHADGGAGGRATAAAGGGEDRATVLVRRGGAGSRPPSGRDTTPCW